MKKLLAAICSTLLGIVGCGVSSSVGPVKTPESISLIKAGGVYATKVDNGKYAISKVLAFDGFAVHLRFFNEQFDSIPSQIDTAKLTFFIGHAPLAVEGFLKDSPTLIVVEVVKDAELEGYKLYLEAMKQQ